jgi:hypothetical protein
LSHASLKRKLALLIVILMGSEIVHQSTIADTSKMKTTSFTQSYSSQTISKFIIALGVLIAISGLILNPWVGKIYRSDSDIINFYDVMLNYFLWAIGIGLIIISFGFAYRVIHSKKIEKILVFLITCLFIILLDRFLLGILGLPPFIADSESFYKLRPSVIKSWGPTFNNKLIYINKYGQHDYNFPIEKKENEFRGLMIGDSIVMGHGVQFNETFSAQLEKMLKDKIGDKMTIKMINAGVAGYSTYQEYNLLKESLIFKPDIIFIGFCMNPTFRTPISKKNKLK